MIKFVMILVFAALGIICGLNIEIPYIYSKYIAVAILACLDSVFGAYSSNLENKFKLNIFLSGFFGNSLIAMVLVYMGDRLNVDIYLAAIIVFSSRLLNNFSNIRRNLFPFEDKKVKDI
ncbi:MAG: small basic family protein, partial [Clostridia bacterium]